MKKVVFPVVAVAAILLLALTISTCCAAPARFVAVQHTAAFQVPPIVLPYDAATKKGFDWQRLSSLNFYQAYTDSDEPIISTVRYLREAVQRMTGQVLP